MGRSYLSNRQALDDEYAFQHELDNASGTLNTKIDTTSGTLQVQHDNHVADDDIHFPKIYVDDLVGTASGTLQNQIDDNTTYITNVSGTLQTDIDNIVTGSGILNHDLLNNVSADDHHNQSHAMTSTADHAAGNWQLFYSDGVGDVQELALGLSGQSLLSAGTSAIPYWATISGGGGGDVTASGTLADNAIIRGDGDSGGKAIQDSGWFIADDNKMTATFGAAANTFMMTLQNSSTSGEFIELLDYDGNSVIQMRSGGGGQGIFNIFMADGSTKYLEAIDGTVKVGRKQATVPLDWEFVVDGSVTGSGVLFRVGENEGDIAFRIEDSNQTFQILDVHADNGQFVFGDTYANALATNGTVYGIDNQFVGANVADFNTENGGYRIAGNLLNIDHLDDVDTTTTAPSVGDTLEWDGNNWVPVASGVSSPFVLDGDVYFVDSTRGDKELGVAIIEVGAGRNSSATTNQYLRTFNGTLMNQTGIPLPYDTTLVGMTMAGSSNTQSWTAQVRKNGSATVLDSLSITNAYENHDWTRNTDFTAGDRVQIYLSGTSISYPQVRLYFRRTN